MLSQRYLVHDLRRLCTANLYTALLHFRLKESNTDCILSLLDYVCNDDCVDSVPELREMAVRFAAAKIEFLRRNERFIQMLRDDAQLSSSLSKLDERKYDTEEKQGTGSLTTHGLLTAPNNTVGKKTAGRKTTGRKTTGKKTTGKKTTGKKSSENSSTTQDHLPELSQKQNRISDKFWDRFFAFFFVIGFICYACNAILNPDPYSQNLIWAIVFGHNGAKALARAF